jgi:Domain of unknown function (DUF4760)
MQTPEATSAQTFELIKLSLAAVGFIVGVISIILVYIQMRKTHEWNRRKASHDTLSEVVTGSIAECRRILSVTFGTEIGTSETYSDVEARVNEEDRLILRHNTRQILNYLEVLCVGMKNNVLDEDICYDYLMLPITRFWTWAKPFIKEERKIDSTDVLWIEVENYAKRWSRREEEEKEQYLERLRVPGKRPT